MDAMVNRCATHLEQLLQLGKLSLQVKVVGLDMSPVTISGVYFML